MKILNQVYAQQLGQDGDLYRVDPLTSSQNFLGFIETLVAQSDNLRPRHFSLVYLDLNHLHSGEINHGGTYSDSIVRWMELVLREESLAPTFRVGGGEFAAILNTGGFWEHGRILEQIKGRLWREASSFNISEPVAYIALIHYEPSDAKEPKNILVNIGAALTALKTSEKGTTGVFFANDLLNASEKDKPQNSSQSEDACLLISWLANLLVNRVEGLGKMLDESQHSALTDSVSGLPNMRAARKAMQHAYQQSINANQVFSVLLIDGDDLRKYNMISYAEGDEMIRKLSAILAENLRFNDFLARWRTGDEWIVVLPSTSSTEAVNVGERFCSAVRGSSQSWRIPTSISIGVASYPENGSEVNELLECAESALRQAKALGKDRVYRMRTGNGYNQPHADHAHIND